MTVVRSNSTLRNAVMISAVLASLGLTAPETALAQAMRPQSAPVQRAESTPATNGTSAAETVLRPGEAQQKADGSSRPSCYLLPTTPGSQWRITVTAGSDSWLQVGRGSCSNMTVDRETNTVWTLGWTSVTSRIDFASGGGLYVIKTWFRESPYAPATYTITAQQRSGVANTGLLPAGGEAGGWLTPGWTPASVSHEPAKGGEPLSRGNVFRDCADVCPEMVVIPAGSFTMGSPAEEAGRTASEGPRHPVALINPFAVGRYEVTFAEYDACVADGGCSHAANDQGWGRGRRPVVDVSWDDAQAYVAWLSKKTGHRYQLPSEAEWEYAARAGSQAPWQTGSAILTDDANILNAFAKTVNVGGYAPNAFGLHDVHGNVVEWTLDCMDTGYVGAPNDGSAATSGECASARIIRGGSFVDEPVLVRFAARKSVGQAMRAANLGFRVVRAL